MFQPIRVNQKVGLSITFRSLWPNKLKRSSLYSFCHHSVSLFLLFSFCHQSVSLTRSSVLGLSANPLLHPVSLHNSYICTHFRFLLQWINSSHKTAKTQLISYMESRISHAKLGFATTAKCSTPTGKQSSKLHKKTRTMKRSFSMTSGDRTIIFMLSLLGLSSKHNQYPSNQIQYSRNPKKIL